MTAQQYRARYMSVTWVQEVAATTTVGTMAARAGQTQYRTDDGRLLWLGTYQFSVLFQRADATSSRFVPSTPCVTQDPGLLNTMVVHRPDGQSATVSQEQFADLYVPVVSTFMVMEGGAS